MKFYTVYPDDLFEELKNWQSVDLASIADQVLASYIQALRLSQQGNKQAAKNILSDIVNSPKASSADSNTQVPIANLSIVELCILFPSEYVSRKNIVKQIKNIATRGSSEKLTARAYHALCILNFWSNRYELAFTEGLNAKSLYTKLNNQQGLSFVFDTLGNICVQSGDVDRGMLFYFQSFSLKSQLGDRVGMAITLGNLARLCFQLGRFEQAIDFVLQDIALIDSQDIEQLAILENLLGRIYTADAQYALAKHYLNSAIEKARASGNNSILFFCLKDWVELLIQREEITHANAALQSLKQVEIEDSDYHRSHRELVEVKLLLANKIDQPETIDKALEHIADKSWFELEIGFRIQQALSYSNNGSHLARDYLLLAKKLIKHSQQLRFLPLVNQLMMAWNIHESVAEESAKPISKNLKGNNGYIIRKLLGEGGFGRVYLAWDVEREQDVALKQFQLNSNQSIKLNKSLWNQARLEFEAAALIKNSMVAKPIALGHDEFGVPYVVHEYIAGQKLSDFMQTVLEPNSIVYYVKQIAQALEYIHDKKIIHRDLKPDNIIISQSGAPVIIDMGIAILTGQEQELSVSGTEAYMPPEQRRSVELDETVDLYALGCIFYQWLSKEPPVPVNRGKGQSLLSKLIKTNHSGIELNESKLKSPFKEIIAKLTAIENKQRPQSATELIKMLEQIN
jgi:serine/threonine protein kinase